MSRDDHYRLLERLYHAAPTNEYYRPRMVVSDGRAEIYTVHIPEEARSVGMTVKDIADRRSFPKESVFIGVYSDERGDFSITRGDSVLQANDTVFLVSKAQYIKDAADFLIEKK